MAMTAGDVVNTLNTMIDNGEIEADDELRILLPQHRSDMSYGISIVVDDMAVPHLEADTSSSEYASTYGG